jgi:hypothetical protein
MLLIFPAVLSSFAALLSLRRGVSSRFSLLDLEKTLKEMNAQP